MARRLLIAAGLIAAVVAALVLFLGGDASERRDGMTAATGPEETPTSMESAPSPDELEGQVAAALAEGLEGDVSSAMGSATPMRRDGGPMGGMNAGMGGDLADPFLYQTPRERERRAEAARNRNWRNLDLVNSLIIGITEGIEKAREEGDTERAERLEATKGRLEARRDALEEALGDSPRPEQEP